MQEYPKKRTWLFHEIKKSYIVRQRVNFQKLKLIFEEIKTKQIKI